MLYDTPSPQFERRTTAEPERGLPVTLYDTGSPGLEVSQAVMPS
jgi:hypothetical protein